MTHIEHAENRAQDDHTSGNPQTPWKRNPGDTCPAQTACSQTEANAT